MLSFIRVHVAEKCVVINSYRFYTHSFILLNKHFYFIFNFQSATKYKENTNETTMTIKENAPNFRKII